MVKLKFYYWCYDTVFGGDHWAIVISNFIMFVFFIFLVMSSHQCDQMSLVTDNGQAATSIAPTAQTIVWSYTRDALCEIHQLNRQSEPSLTPMHFARIRNLWGMFAR